ncbi:hypothetical protein J8F10_11170 [Gemmata sp. G18]|uniref:RiboL-PSP-HEPN domain-containing protein n=1 Tax=Gemmata palustris TaxID=2822762 RepID=A0ABS5BQA7_9BACT|nr:hypothetical protein [Gemmata palustris]MBP3955845.1 hypothetical protein [Gemmata palustris]
MKRQERIERVRAIEREFWAAAFAANLLDEALQKDSGLLAAEAFKVPDVRNWKKNLEGTYLIRMFAEFEATLRDVWARFFKRDTHPRMVDLIDAIAGYQFVPDDVIDGAHAVRRYRNSLVHEGGEEAATLPFGHARSFLGSYLSRLPTDW